MGKLSVWQGNQGICISEQLEKYERVNYEELKLLLHGSIPLLLPVQLVEKGKKQCLEAWACEMVPLSAYYCSNMRQQVVISILRAALKLALECERLGLRADNLIWSWDMMFVDRKSKLHMVYWPVIRLEAPSGDMLNFFRGFMQVVQDCRMDPKLVHMYCGYFYQRETMDLPAFQQMIQQLVEQWKAQREEAKRLREEKEQADKEKVWQNRLERSSRSRTNWFSAWLESEDGIQRHMLDGELIYVGRDPAVCGAIIESDPGVSRRHAKVINIGDDYFLQDMGSRNGTFHNGKRLDVNIRVKLEDGDTVQFSKSRFLFHKNASNKTVHIHDFQRR